MEPDLTWRPGVRYSVRFRLPDGRATDVVGRVTEVGPDAVTLVDRAEQEHRVARGAVVVAKAVPVPRGPDPRTADARTLELIAADSWHDVVEPLGDWRLRYAGGATNRANSCLAVGDPGRPVAEAAEAIVAYADRHAITPQAQVICGSAEDAALIALGWVPVRSEVAVLVARLVDLCGDAPGAAEITEELREDWFDRYRAEHPSDADDDQLKRLLRSGRSVFARRYDAADLVAIGRASLAADWGTLFGLWTDPSRRRQGLMRDLVGSLCWWTAARGARSAQLQVDTANIDALEAYARLGFSEHHRYRYLRPHSRG